MELAVIILAAGKGTRMRSHLPKVAHPIAGRPMLAHVIDGARSLAPARICVVYGHGGDLVREKVPAADVTWAEQAEQLGTGHAVAQAMPHVSEDVVLILYGDVPLIQPDTLRSFVERVTPTRLALMTLEMDDPGAYGRIVRNAAGEVQAIVEFKDADPAQRAIREINTGILACPRKFLAEVLPKLSSNNAQGEYYLTDVIAMAVEAGLAVEAVQPAFPWEVDGVNDRVQLARLERIFQQVQAEQLMRAGATVLDPARLDIRGTVECGQDVVLDVNVVLEGAVSLADGVRIGPNCVIRNAQIGRGTVVEANSVIDGAEIGEACQIGPFARLRPGTVMASRGKIGNFVETKNTRVGTGSKINHLSYVGDSELGEHVNVGAGTITCNYDGVNKSQTLIGDNAFIGSNASLVAPVTIGKEATVGAGSVITRDVAAGELAVARGKQRNISGWQRPQKKD
ncbi:bifunctional UDP-N-acetylglucosamine diphosphorylase/glucosamine-1-phosphate N-acetyltransferase GlmU [Alcanivorax quisquiliarum]|uniref:Bifunctional protein GlmU n=1 Tax=Alcanivorax quisquiliarum TaxID=2933565 RepID=A0ABT0E536_9GAMM|nr:bifunctional UDP-N-acetylglucosamine diphosphorylase/glucosamine-1-phosphate N-acetyltransferase GlmU [Alcanivorax quisquiliarum]MCK0536868.1 bifunctional UDP-N-acetylglucosamine diphosphorylase/glucosamine-1-phosphate N-acetyltransferase GlmU [Alcanivorax quisquiliarum]